MACAIFIATSSYAKADATPHEIEQVRFAERVVVTELARGLSLSQRKICESVESVCPETGAMALAITLIGMSRSDAGRNALINLLGLKLDGEAAEERSCQILLGGRFLLSRLKNLKVTSIHRHCHEIFLASGIPKFSDVTVDQVCATESEILAHRDAYVKAIGSKATCDD